MAGQMTKRTYTVAALAITLIVGLSWHIFTASAYSRGHVNDLLQVSRPDYVLEAQEYERPPKEDLAVTSAEHVAPATPTESASPPPQHPTEDVPGYGSKLYFENELPYKFPNLDITSLKAMAPHNYRGAGHAAFATMFLSRNPSLQHPYFLATHEVVYRLLWNQDTKSTEHPVIVFVAPFVSHEQLSKPLARLFRDVFCKLEMWAQTDFSRIAYLDSDAFPLVNIDALMSQQLARERSCRRELLWTADLTHAEESCRYTFTAVQDLGVSSMFNAGVMVLQPNTAMYELLLSDFEDPDNVGLLNSGFPEQGLLSPVFRLDGPFPATIIGKAWNGDAAVKDLGGHLNILHAKLWALTDEGSHWTDGMFAKTWEDLSAFYVSEEFAGMRAQDSTLFEKYSATS